MEQVEQVEQQSTSCSSTYVFVITLLAGQASGTGRALCRVMTRTSLRPQTPEQAHLVQSHLGLARAVAVRIAKQSRTAIEVDELYSFGCIGLIHAAQRFSADRGFKFITFAYPRVYGAIIDGMASLAPLSRRIHRRANIFVQSVDGGQLDRKPSSRPTAVETVQRRQSAQALYRALQALPSKSRTLLFQHYFSEQSLAESSAELGHTKSWGSRTHKRALAQLREELGSWATEAA